VLPRIRQCLSEIQEFAQRIDPEKVWISNHTVLLIWGGFHTFILRIEAKSK
jgi:hypothetical protein